MQLSSCRKGVGLHHLQCLIWLVKRTKEPTRTMLPTLITIQLQVIPGGVLGYKRDGGPTEPNILHPNKYMDLLLCTHKNTGLEILDPKRCMAFFIA